MNENEFHSWLDTFVKEHGGFKPPRQWFGEVNESKKKLRELLGGTKKLIPIELDNAFYPCDFDQIAPKIKLLKSYVPEYFTFYKLNDSDLCHPLIPSTKFAGMTWPKHMTFWINKNRSKVSSVGHLTVSKTLGDLGQIWAKLRTNKQIMHVVLSTEPKDFCKIGHYGPDSGSCFKQGSSNQMHKYWLGLHPNSFVLVVQKDDQEPSLSVNPAHCRAWGVGNEDLTVFNIANFYAKSGVNPANLHISIEKYFAKLIGNGAKPKRFENLFNVTGMYLNRGTGVVNWSLSNIRSGLKPQEFHIDKSGCLLSMVKCSICEGWTAKPQNIIGTNCIYCESCYDKQPTCEYDSQKYYGSSVRVIGLKGVFININPYYVTNGTFVLSSASQIYYHKDTCVKTASRSWIALSDMKPYGYKLCQKCKIASKTGCSICKTENVKKLVESPF